MKSYTDLEQSKKLAEILPLESADGFWEYHNRWYSEGDEWEGYEDYPTAEPYLEYTRKENEWKENKSDIPAWSLAALLGVIPYNVTFNKAVYCFKLVKFSNHWECYHENFGTVSTEIFKADNPVDACYEMILKLHDLNLL